MSANSVSMSYSPAIGADVYGEAPNKAQRFWQLADYSGDPVRREDAAWAVEQAEAFIAAVRARFVL